MKTSIIALVALMGSQMLASASTETIGNAKLPSLKAPVR
jgi:hypothetical protein